MARPSRFPATSAAASLAAVLLVVATTACTGPSQTAGRSGGSGSLGSAGASRSDTAPCPVAPIRVVVTVNPWADIVEQLGGACVHVTTIVTGAVDPHDFEPSPADIVTFSRAELVVVNGMGDDSWADKALDATDPRPRVVDAGTESGRAPNTNPHIWYSPTAVRKTAEAVTAALRATTPGAEPLLATQAALFADQLREYDKRIAAVREVTNGKSYAATETVFADMADAVGLRDDTPEGYRAASTNGTDPSPADIAAFRSLLRDRRVAVLVYNSQTSGAVPEQLRDTATGAGVPVVEITETIPPDTAGFFAWQLTQLDALRRAVGT